MIAEGDGGDPGRVRPNDASRGTGRNRTRSYALQAAAAVAWKRPATHDDDGVVTGQGQSGAVGGP